MEELRYRIPTLHDVHMHVHLNIERTVEGFCGV